MNNVLELIPENIRDKQNLPPHQMSQYLYPRIAIGDPGPDGEITFRLILGLPCCGVDLDVECPPTLTIAEMGEIVRAFFELRQKIRSLPSFNACML